MNRRVEIVCLIVTVATIVTSLTACAPTSQQDKTDLGLPKPSPTWLFSSASSAATPTQFATRQPTSTPHPEMLRQGQRLFYEVGCFSCHGLTAEGAEGPHIARTQLELDWVIQQVYQPSDEMPPFSPVTVDENELAAIYAYLQSLKPTGPRPQITTDYPDPATGKALYFYFGCFGCHGYHSEGGFGLKLAGTTLSLEEVRSQVRNPRGRMPAFRPERISDEELTHIYAFLQSMASYGESN